MAQTLFLDELERDKRAQARRERAERAHQALALQDPFAHLDRR